MFYCNPAQCISRLCGLPAPLRSSTIFIAFNTSQKLSVAVSTSESSLCYMCQPPPLIPSRDRNCFVAVGVYVIDADSTLEPDRRSYFPENRSQLPTRRIPGDHASGSSLTQSVSSKITITSSKFSLFPWTALSCMLQIKESKQFTCNVVRSGKRGIEYG